MNNNSKKIESFTDLNAWKEAHKLVLMIYKITKDFPKEEMFGLTSQIRRAVISITSNIAEGFSRQTYKEKIQFYFIAKSSLTEVQNQLLIARDINYINKQDFDDIADQSIIVHKLLNGLIKKSKDIQNSKFKIQNSSKGFTLIEIIIAIFIMGIMFSITVPQYAKYRDSKSLFLGTGQVVGDIRMVQNYAYSILKDNGSFPVGGYGIHFSKDSNTYTIFADKDDDMEYDSDSESFKEIKLPESVKITSLKINSAEELDGAVDLVFTPPYGKVFIDKENKISGNFINLEIIISNNSGFKTVNMSSSRLIN